MKSCTVFAIFLQIFSVDAEEQFSNFSNIDSFGSAIELTKFDPKDLSTNVNYEALQEMFKHSAVAQREIIVISCVGFDSNSKHVMNQILLHMYRNVSKFNEKTKNWFYRISVTTQN